MEPDIYWELFLATGDPVAYMLYRGMSGEEGETPIG